MTEELKQKYKLPVAKQIVYYDVANGFKKYRVTDLCEKEIFPEWCVLNITLDKGINKDICSRFLKQMQSPDFIDEYLRESQK